MVGRAWPGHGLTARPRRGYGRVLLYAFGFDRIGVLVADLYFVDPSPSAGQEGAERGARLERFDHDAQPFGGCTQSVKLVHWTNVASKRVSPR